MCSSEVSDTDLALRAAFEGQEGLTMAWVFVGPGHRAQAWVEEYSIGLPVLVDEDGDFGGGGAWFVGQDEGHAWASNPRHFVIDGEGVLRYGATTPDTAALIEAIQAQLRR